MKRRFPTDDHVVINTGQHSERGMSDIFFDQLDLPELDSFLELARGRGMERTETAAPRGIDVYGRQGSTVSSPRAGRSSTATVSP
jgi:hypothetical protein